MRSLGRWALRASVFVVLCIAALTWGWLPPKAVTLDVSGWRPQTRGHDTCVGRITRTRVDPTGPEPWRTSLPPRGAPASISSS